MSVQLKDIKREIKVEKQEIEEQYENETGEKSMSWNSLHFGDNDKMNTSAVIKREYESDEDSKCPQDENFVTFQTIYIKQENLKNENEIEDDYIENNKDDEDYSNIDCKGDIDIQDHLLVQLKEEPGSDTETPYDGSTSQAEGNPDIEMNQDENPEIIYECEICLKKFTHELDHDIHMRFHSGDRSNVCPLCNKIFTERGTLVTHMRSHTGARPYQCEICKKKFRRKGHVNEHMRTHSGKRPFECEVCKKTFTQKSVLTSHMRVHTGEKPYVCDICNKGFTIKGHLKEHKRIHSGEKPYSCEVCKKAFAHTGTLTIHMRLHSGEKPFKCEVCSETFVRTAALTKHMRKHAVK